MKQCGTGKSFTLIELLVVIAIIGILASMLLPSLQKAREKTYMAVCGSQQKQQGAALVMYTDTNDGYLPGVHTAAGGVMVWATRIKVYMDDNYAIFNCPKQDREAWWEEDLSGGGAAEYGYKTNEQRVTNNNRKFGYGMNDWGTDGWNRGRQLGLGNHVQNPDQKGLLKILQVVNPAEHIATGDSTANQTWDFVMDPTNTNEYPGNIHFEGAMIMFTDGHIEYMKQYVLVGLNDEMKKKWNSDNVANH